MTNRQFDDLVRRRIQTEEMKMNHRSEEKLAQDMWTPKARRAVRRISARSLVLATVILALLCGVALAAVTWNSREYLTYTDKTGKVQANEALISLAQPVGRVYEGESLRVEVVDAIYDGRSLVLTWTLQSKRAEGDIYLLVENGRKGGDALLGQGGTMGMDEIFLAPGETVNSGLTTLFEDTVDLDACEVSFIYTVLAPKGEAVPMAYPHDLEGDAFTQAYQDEVNRINAEGNLALAPDGVIELGDLYPENPGDMTRSEILVAAGKMDLLETVDVHFTVMRNSDSYSLLPDGKPIEQDNGDYILRVNKADISPNSATFELERVFKTKEAAEKYAAYYSEKLGPFWGFDFQDETNSLWYANGGGGSTMEVPEEQPDGTWVWNYNASMTQLYSQPRAITILPLRDDLETGEYNIPYPEEAVALKAGQ